MYLYEVIVPEKKSGLIIPVTLFPLVTLQPFMDFGLLHQIIPGFSVLDELALISLSFFKSFHHFISPSVLWPSFDSYSYRVQINNLF